MTAIYVDNFIGTWNSAYLYKIMQIGSGDGITFARPNVLYNGIIYRYIASPTPVLPATNPITYKTPDTDTSAVALYTLGGGGSVNVLSTVLAGLAPASGAPLATSTLLQALNFLSFRSYAFVSTISGAITANGAVPLTGAVLGASADITLATPAINIPQAKSFHVLAVLSVTTAATSGCSFAIGGANATVATNVPVVVGASATNSIVTIGGLVTPTAANPTITILASGFSGTVTLANTSYLQITQV